MHVIGASWPETGLAHHNEATSAPEACGERGLRQQTSVFGPSRERVTGLGETFDCAASVFLPGTLCSHCVLVPAWDTQMDAFFVSAAIFAGLGVAALVRG